MTDMSWSDSELSHSVVSRPHREATNSARAEVGKVGEESHADRPPQSTCVGFKGMQQTHTICGKGNYTNEPKREVGESIEEIYTHVRMSKA